MTRGRSKALEVFGRELKRYRTAAGLSQDQLGVKIHLTGSQVGKIERGESRCRRSLAERLDELLDTRGALPSLWDQLVVDAAFPVWFDWPKIESDAVILQTYQCLVVPGLLQTERYASALLSGDKEAVAARMSRQDVLVREDPPPPRLTVVLYEGVLHHQVGEVEVMREQLQRLTDRNGGRVSIQVVATYIPPAGSTGSFVLATLDDGHEMAYVDTGARGITLHERDDIRTLTDRLDAIRARALPVDMSNELIGRIVEDKWT